MKHRIFLILLTAALAAAWAGCGDRAKPDDPQREQRRPEGSAPAVGGPANWEAPDPANGEELFAISKATGSVTELFDGGCKLTPTHTDGDVAYEAAPGYENEDDLITVSYHDDCIFRIAYVDIQTGTAAYEAANGEDIKKQASLIVCGDYDAENILHATRVFIYRSVR